jgi:proteasome lid subunit RPN8/RPN11
VPISTHFELADIPADTLLQMVAHARECYPQECCGLLVQGRYMRCRNIARQPEQGFAIHPKEYARIQPDGVVHSHPDADALPTLTDLAGMRASALPWVIIGLPHGKEGNPQICLHRAAAQSLIGRRFIHGVSDCYSIIRDWYQCCRQITLPDFIREDRWWLNGENLYAQHFAEAGFIEHQVDAELQPGDVLLMRIGAQVVNHGAVYLGEGKILHHLYNRLSCEELYGGYYQRATVYRLRYA